MIILDTNGRELGELTLKNPVRDDSKRLALPPWRGMQLEVIYWHRETEAGKFVKTKFLRWDGPPEDLQKLRGFKSRDFELRQVRALAFLAIIALGGCGSLDDGQSFNVSALTPLHQVLFADAMGWWNARSGGVYFEADRAGPSDVIYGTPWGGKAGWFYKDFHAERDVFGNRRGGGHRIVLKFSAVSEYPGRYLFFCGLARHELGHHPDLFGSWHSPDTAHVMNPTPPACPWGDIPPKLR